MMKKIFALVLLLVLGKLSYAQYPITQTLGSDSTIVISKGALQSRLINVTYTDTTAANLQRIRQYPGAQIATTTGGLNLWIRNATATAWIPVATGSGNNIYTIDGTLLGNRTLTGAGYSLTFNQLSKLLFNADSTTINTDQATISNNGVSTLSVKGATGRMFLVDTTAPADERIYELKSSNGEFYISILNDAQTSNDSAFLITSASRVGINTLNPDSTLKVGGGVNILGGLRVGNLPTSPGTKQLRINAQGQFSVTDTLIDAGGTVTSVATNDGTGITGGTITTSGTLAIDTTIISTRAWRQKGVDSLQANINLKLNIVDTTGMLANYVNSVGYGLGKTSQTVYVDSASLSNYYLRRKDSLTATNPLGYVTQKILADTAAAIRASDAGGSVTSVGLTMPAAFNVGNSPITTAGTISVTAAGLVSQYIRGDGTLADFPGGGGGGGASISYYLNGSVNQGTFGGNTYYEMNKTPIFGTGTDFSINADGYIAQFITDAGDPGLLKIPGGNWNFELFFNASSGGGTPTYYVELYKYDGTTFTLIASGSSNPDVITGGTSVEAYFSTLPVPETVLLATDRLAVRIYVTHAGRTITLHTEDNNLCQVITTFTTGITALNGLTEQVQYFTTGTSGTDFNISSSVATHTFNLPTASATNRGALSTTDWTTFNNKVGGSLISGYITKATGTNTIDTSQLFQSNGLIGIGTTSPTQKLQVSGNAYVNGQLFAGDTALSTYQVEGILSTPYVLGRKAVDNTLSTEARPTGIQGHVVGRGSIANRLQGGTFYATTDSASTANSTGSLRASNSWSAHNGSGTLANAWGSYNIVQNKTTGTITNAYGSVSGVENRGATSTINKLHGTTTEIWNNFGGTVDTAFGQVISIYNNNAASNIGAVYGLSIGKGLVTPTGGTHYWKNSGTIGTSYGLYLDTSIDVGTTKYSIFSNSNSNSYFKGKLGVGTTSPDSAFQVATGALFQRGVRMSALPQAPGTKALRIDASGTISYADTLIDAGGTVTSVATNNGTGITGGTITTTGTLAIDTLLISTRAWRQKGIDSVAALINSNVSGTTNYVAKFTGSNTIGNSQIIDNGTAVAIGTAASNAYKLSVAGIYRGVGVGDAARIELFDTQAGGATFFVNPQQSLGVTSLGTYGAFPILFVTNSAERIRISSAGDVTISTIANATVDTDKFLVSDSGVIKYRTGAEVLSDIGGASSSSISGTTNYIPKFTSSSAIGNSTLFDNGSNIGLGTNSPSASYRVTISGSTYQVGTNSKIYIDNGGVGGASAILGVVGTSYGYLNTDGGFPFVFQTNNTERMRLDASGNLIVGGTSASSIFNINGVDPLISFQNAGSTKWQVGLENTSSDRFIWYNNAGASYRMILTASGNLGLGVTPSAWGSNYKAIQGGNGSNGVGGSVAFFNNLANGLLLYSNATNDNTNDIYTFTAPAAKYVLENNVYKWFQAPQGTAGNAISFTQAMTLDASGRLGIGTTSPQRMIHGYIATGPVMRLQTNGSNAAAEFIPGATDGTGSIFNWVIGAQYNIGNAFEITPSNAAGSTTFSTPAFVVTSSRNVGIGTTSPYAILDLGASGVSNNMILRNTTSAFNLGYIGNAGGRVDIGFSNSNSSLVALPYLSVTSGGNVGIGTTSPASKLHISNNGAYGIEIDVANEIIQAYNRTTSDYNEIKVYSSNLRFFNGTSATITERMRITSGGRVGIGQTAPGTALSVAGQTESWQLALTSVTGTAGAIIGSPSANVLAFGDWGGTERMRITSGGDLLIATTTDAGAYPLQVNGSVYATAYYESSDLRLKNVLSERQGSDGINTITFKWKDGRDSLTHIGYAAQQVEKVLPDAVKTNTDGYKTINYDEVQSLKIANLEQEIAELKKIIKQLIDKK